MSRFRHEEFDCPRCGQHFTQNIQGSYSIFGIYLDFMPYGAAVVPDPLPQCPRCQFVLRFVPELSADILKELEKKDFYALEPNMPPHYYLAKTIESLFTSDKILAALRPEIICNYVSAIWYAYGPSYSAVEETTENKEDVSEEPVDYTFRNSLHSYFKLPPNTYEKIVNIVIPYIDAQEKGETNYFTNKLMKLDFLRRLKRFDEALALLEEIEKDPDYHPEEGCEELLSFQRELIAKKDTARYTMEKERDWY